MGFGATIFTRRMSQRKDGIISLRSRSGAKWYFAFAVVFASLLHIFFMPMHDKENQSYEQANYSSSGPAGRSEIKEKCTINSKTWLRGPRLGNIHQELDGYDHLVKQMLLETDSILLQNPFQHNGHLSSLLSQTICLPQSRLRNVSISSEISTNIDETDDSNSDSIIRQWAVKLIFLSLHYHQHKYAMHEAQHRFNAARTPNGCSPVSQMELTNKYGVGRFDYECPDAKYLVITLKAVGLGANVRAGIVPALMLGLMTDRVVLLINNVPKSVDVPNQQLLSGWQLASCPRLDYQCTFWPISPCVLSYEEIANAHALNISETRRLKDDIIPNYANHHKVWILETELLPIHGYHGPSADKLYEYAKQMLSRLPESVPTLYKNLLTKAAEFIRVDDGNRKGFRHANSRVKVQHTITIYSTRPHPQIVNMLESQSLEIIPADFNPANSIGLPVRASDKCDKESECLTFSQHMTVAGEMWEKYLNSSSRLNDPKYRQPSILFTTEATSMVEEQKVFATKNNGVLRYPGYNFTFITNPHDVTPNSGFIKDSRRNDTHDADALMISVLSTIKLQLYSQITIANCCSGFHQMLNDFLFEGCGAIAANTYHCLQDTDDPLLVPCCGYYDKCVERKKQILLEMEKKAATPQSSFGQNNT